MRPKWDLFDVHSGLIEMEVYLAQRHNEEDLKTVVDIPAEKWVEFVKPPPPPPQLPERRPQAEFVVQAPPVEEEVPEVEDLIENFRKAAQEWEERNQ